jgi:hypothetical protein
VSAHGSSQYNKCGRSTAGKGSTAEL